MKFAALGRKPKRKRKIWKKNKMPKRMPRLNWKARRKKWPKAKPKESLAPDKQAKRVGVPAPGGRKESPGGQNPQRPFSPGRHFPENRIRHRAHLCPRSGKENRRQSSFSSGYSDPGIQSRFQCGQMLSNEY